MTDRLAALGYIAVKRGACLLVTVGDRQGYVMPESLEGTDDDVREVVEGVRER
jgi:hypothetical protein